MGGEGVKLDKMPYWEALWKCLNCRDIGPKRKKCVCGCVAFQLLTPREGWQYIHRDDEADDET